jgi:hypothetical protein
MTGAHITPPDHTDPIEEPSNDRLSPNPRVILTNFSLPISNIKNSLLIRVRHHQKPNGENYLAWVMYHQNQ